MSWADLDKVSVKQRADGSSLLVLQDGRTATQMGEARLVSILVAMCRVARARAALVQKFGGAGSVVYVVHGTPPSYLVEAVTAAGGVVFDGKSEHTMPKPMAATMLLDATLCDLATVVRRRVNVRTFGDALEVREHELKRRPVPRTDLVAWWTTVFELIALAGELFRAEMPGTWQLAGSQRPPLVLKQPKQQFVLPGPLAAEIADGSGASLRALVELSKPRPPKATLDTSLRLMPLLVARTVVPLDGRWWETLVPEDADHEELPVIAYVEDVGETVTWPDGTGRPSAALRSRALSNLARTTFEIADIEGLPVPIVVVTSEEYGAEAILHRPTMQELERRLGTDSIIVGIPDRTHIIATTSEIDPDDLVIFLRLVENRFDEASERTRIARDAVLYAQGKPVGRVQSSTIDTRRALVRMGIDPDA